ncbi:MAG: hypothetical protein U9P12_00490 [Verrucomicrobiota bacterium]|nr:hypothetical protein [Verrucomicrobiota bacterium]
MKAIDHFEQNRPVHLARRDVYFERAAELISVQQKTFTPEIEIEDYEEILFLLRVARQHARFSIRNKGKNGDDEQFGRFINLLAGNVKAVLSMMTLKHTVEGDESFFSFLGANQASVALQAEEYQRRANDIVRSIHNTLKLAEEPFEQLKVDNAAASSDDFQKRYDKAHGHFSRLVKEGRHRYKIAPSARKIAHG